MERRHGPLVNGLSLPVPRLYAPGLPVWVVGVNGHTAPGLVRCPPLRPDPAGVGLRDTTPHPRREGGNRENTVGEEREEEMRVGVKGYRLSEKTGL